MYMQYEYVLYIHVYMMFCVHTSTHNTQVFKKTSLFNMFKVKAKLYEYRRVNGAFLLRRSNKRPGTYTVSVT